jgi:uncharacterized protein YhaN
MKLLELDLRAFGPFTDAHLDLSAGREGLHLVFGPNEAGKSSALRALRALLFGIPERTRDDFRHDKQALRLGGRLRNREGEELALVRRKGRKNTLLNADEQPIGEDALQSFIGKLDERQFERLFGIDHETLVSGGQALLDERGREAEALFGTALGTVAIHRVLARLDQEARDLFAPRASKPMINALLSEFGEAEHRLREATLSVRHWEQAKQTLDRTTAALAAMDETIEQITGERNRLERIRRTLPELVRRDRLNEQLGLIGEVPRLADDFASRREEAVAKQARAAEARANAQGRLERLRATIGDLRDGLSEDLLRDAESIDDLRERLGSHRKAERDRGALVAEQVQRQAESAALLRRVRPDLTQDAGPADVDRLKPLLTRRRRATELGASQAALVGAVVKTRADLAETQDRLRLKTAALTDLPAPVSSTALERVLADARRAGDLDQGIAAMRVGLAKALEVCETDLGALGLWSGGLADLPGAPLPDEASVRRFADEARGLSERRETLEQKRLDDRAEQVRCEEALRALELIGSVPSEDDLIRARGHRDQGWQLVRQAWLAGADVTDSAREYGADRPLDDAFEVAMIGADEVADRLRREAQHVHERATTRARAEVCAQRITETDHALVELDRRMSDWEIAWVALWVPAGLTPLPPVEMLPWLNRALRLCETIRQTHSLSTRLDEQEAIRRVHRSALLSVLDAPVAPEGPCNSPHHTPALQSEPEHDLGGLIGRAEDRLRAMEEGARARLALEREVADLDERKRRLTLELAEANAALQQWQADWTSLMAELGLAPEASPGEVSDHLQTIADALKQAESALAVRARIQGIDRDASAFRAEARERFERLAPDLLERPIEEAVTILSARLGEQRGYKTRLEELVGQADRTEQEVRESETAAAAAAQVLAELCRQAGCNTPDQLPLIEERVRERRRLADQLAEVESGLIQAGDGLGITALAEEGAGIHQDRVVARLQALDARLEQEMRPAHRALIEQKADADRVLKAMGGEGAAAAVAEETQQLLASIRNRAEQYVRIKLAARILRDEIEHFRREHSDPILKRTGSYFRSLTCGSFIAVETDFDESDQPVLVGLRNSGERLHVDAMSTGTRDQLYLALRLASLEPILEGTEPMPFVVDDILIQFDDERARATLETLADFSTKTQVILFTHHGRDIEQARQLDPDQARIWVHRLG